MVILLKSMLIGYMGDKMTFNPEVAAMHYKKDTERRAKADEKGHIWTLGDGWAACEKL